MRSVTFYPSLTGSNNLPLIICYENVVDMTFLIKDKLQNQLAYCFLIQWTYQLLLLRLNLRNHLLFLNTKKILISVVNWIACEI